MRGLGILVAIVIFFWLIWPVIARWLKRKAMERTEDYIRASMGMPPRDKNRGKGKDQRDQRDSFYHQQQRNHNQNHRSPDEPIIPKEYAEDVEFVETKEYSSETRIHADGKTTIETYHESQISDVEWTEVKKPRTK